MPIGMRKICTEQKFRHAALIFRSLWVAFFMVLLVGSLGMSLGAQTISIKLVNGKNGHPIAGTCVNVWVGSERKAAMAIPTGRDGVASLRLTNEDAEISTRVRGGGVWIFWGGRPYREIRRLYPDQCWLRVVPAAHSGLFLAGYHDCLDEKGHPLRLS